MWYVFNNVQECQTAIAGIKAVVLPIMESLGYTVSDGKVYGKRVNNVNGNAVAVEWTAPIELTDGRWATVSLRPTFRDNWQMIENAVGLPEPIDVESLVPLGI